MQLVKTLQARSRATRGTDFDPPRTFLCFLTWLGVTPSLGQAELARVAYDGQMPQDDALARVIFGDIDFAALTPQLRRVFTAVVGGRGGKSYVLIALRLLWGALTRDLATLAPGEDAYATVVAPNDRHRQQVINYALGAARTKPELRALLRLPKGTKPEDKPSKFGVYRPDFDRVVTFFGAVASAGGADVRGKWHTDLALDECAFFRDENAKVSDKDIYDAGVPRVLPGGQVIVGSTPWAQSGLLYDLWRENWGKPTTSLVAHAPTLLLNDTPTIRGVVEMVEKSDPDNAAREYGAQFMTGGTTVFFESSAIDAMLSEDAFALQAGDQVFAGGDFGFRSDSSALIMSALRGLDLHIFDGTEERPEQGAPLKPSATVSSFADVVGGRCTYVMADNHYREAIAEHLEEHGLVFAAAPTIPADTYIRARMLSREGRIVIHPLRNRKGDDFRTRLVQQLREVQGKPTSGGGMSIVHPRWSKGGHGDLASAFVLSVWQAVGDTVPEVAPERGTAEWVTEGRDKRQAAMRARQDRPAWMAKGDANDRGSRAHWRKA